MTPAKLVVETTIPSSTPHQSMRGAPGLIGFDGICSLVAEQSLVSMHSLRPRVTKASVNEAERFQFEGVPASFAYQHWEVVLPVPSRKAITFGRSCLFAVVSRSVAICYSATACRYSLSCLSVGWGQVAVCMYVRGRQVHNPLWTSARAHTAGNRRA